jgi:hypothetical protein
MGLGGMIVAYRLTRSTRRAEEAVEGVPADEPIRTAALLIACLVPFSVASVAMAHVIVAWHVEPMAWANVWDHFSAVERDAMMVAGALAGLGGPVLGVCLGRWWRWPGAALLATVVLVAWSILTLVPWDSPLGNIWHMTSPFVLWYSGANEDPTLDVLGGSPTLRLLYLIALIGLAATTALLHGATGPRREQLRRWFLGLAAAAVVGLLVAALTGPTSSRSRRRAEPVTGVVLGAVPWSPVTGGTALGLVALATDRWLVPSGPGSALIWFALAGFASGSRRWRTAWRLAAGLLPLAAWLGGTAVVTSTSAGLSWAALAVTGTGLVTVTLAAATALRRTGGDTPGEVVASAVGGAILMALLVGVPRVGPVLEAYDGTARSTVWWAVLAVASAGVIAWGSTDPSRG